MILAGDVGGTKVHLALYDFQGGTLRRVRDEKFPAQEFASLEAVVERVSGGDAPARRAQIAGGLLWVSGAGARRPAEADESAMDAGCRELSRSLGIEHIFLINDLEANGYGIPELAPDRSSRCMRAMPSAVGHRGLISAGTGLGEALLIWDGKHA